MVFARAREIFYLFTEIAPMWFDAAFARRTHQRNGEPSVERHRDKRRLSITRDPFDAHLLGVDVLIRLQIVKCARSAPAPCPQRTPVVRLAGLTFICKADDPLRETSAVIGLDAAGLE